VYRSDCPRCISRCNVRVAVNSGMCVTGFGWLHYGTLSGFSLCVVWLYVTSACKCRYFLQTPEQY
jgi:hypothetical protein